jgi:Tfp pilus assembly protein PilF
MIQTFGAPSLPVRRRAALSPFTLVAVLALAARFAAPAQAQTSSPGSAPEQPLQPPQTAQTDGTADDSAAVDEATKLNTRALEEYDNLSFDVAHATLDEALALCAKSGLDNHPIKARTYIHMGVVVLASGPGQRDEAIKQFQRALAIQPDIRLTARVASPEVQSAFNEAKARTATPPTPEKTEPPAVDGTAGTTEAIPITPGLSHDAVASAAQNRAIPISVTTDASLAVKKVAVWFRPEGSPTFVAVELREYTPGNWSGSIPEDATAGDEVAYFVSAENEDGELVGKQGTARAPLVVKLKSATAARSKKGGIPEPEEPEREAPPEEPTWYLGLEVGSGFGSVTGNGDINNQDKVSSGFGRSSLGHALPEIGTFVTPGTILSLQFRWQFVSGATSVRDTSNTMCGANHVCDPATGALAAFARMTWLFGEGVFVPYLSAAVGAGQIRHLATFPGAISCGGDPAHPVKCVDTVTAGPILIGPGVGLLLRATPNFGVILGVNTLVGLPQYTLHFDFNAGIALAL